MTGEPRPAPWHALGVADVLGRLDVGANGLDDDEAERRLARVGPNRLPEAPREGWVSRLLRQFANVLIYVLLAAAGVSLALGHVTDALVILAVVVINAIIGFVQEGRAERSLDAIRGLLAPSATVVRGGRRRRIAAESLVPGDLVVLEPGDRIVADARLAQARDLAVDEAALTGESLPVAKAVDPVAPEAGLADRAAMVYAGTLVAAGHGRGFVVATGPATEIGRIGTLVATVEPMTTPLLRRLARFGQWLTAAILGLSAVTFAVGVLGHGEDAVAMFMAAVGIAVAAIPEGLPAILTITLAIGVERMARRKAIVRRLPAVEALGSVTVVCTDKTGTLTLNEMAVEAVVVDGRRLAVEGVGYAPAGRVETAPGSHALVESLARAALLCNDAEVHEKDGHWVAAGDPTEAALVALGGKIGLDAKAEREAWPRVDAQPFAAETRFMATLNRRADGGGLVSVKGAPERVFDLVAGVATADGRRPLDRDAWHRSAAALAAEGHRVLAVASAEALPGIDRLEARALAGLTLLGLVGISDPPREEARAAIARCRAAGIRVKMVTGDHPETAGAIARALGLDMTGGVIAGGELAGLDDAAFAERVQASDVLARTSPEQKLRLVRSLQARGELVAMTGDGVNDAPALKQADVGVAMGVKGTEAAKEAAQIVLADDNFVAIADAVEQGRAIYDNVKKAILYILPTSFAEALTVVVAVALGVALPITPVQILWVNLVTEVTLSLALVFERAESDVMARPPRPPGEPLMSGTLAWRTILVTALFLAGAFGLFVWQLGRGGDLATARTVAVNAVVVFEVFYLFSARSFVASAITPAGWTGARPALVASAIVLTLQLALTYLPAAHAAFDTRPIDGVAWAAIVAAGAAVFAVVEFEKAIQRGRAQIRRA